MWLPILVCFLIINENSLALSENEFEELKKSLIESLKADPTLLADPILSNESRGFISEKVDKFIQLVYHRFGKIPRVKRSLNEESSKTISHIVGYGKVILTFKEIARRLTIISLQNKEIVKLKDEGQEVLTNSVQD
ncbi:hypothetical protein ABEB36_004031 [Hypothenemus hampei]|uniref:Uncharacterized protein n=1 Tax=Hypothenemus hampei TaxID=57062 RepID=A0ABD1F1Y3_HYPHA